MTGIIYVKIIESLLVIFLFIVLRKLLSKLVDRTIINKVVQKSRIQLVKKVISFITSLVFLAILMIIWGVKQSQLVVFVGSLITIVGVAFVAQWSLLSNITSGIILFFNHSVKIGDSISIMEAKDYQIQGEVIDIGLFFTKIRQNETEDEISLPNNIFIIKTVRKIDKAVDE